jgi:5-methylthioadenosine/S-adenosylhomocysteine deaminase
LLREVARAAEEQDYRVAIHLSQSRIENERVRARDGLSPAELLEQVGLLNDRLMAAHCLYLSESDIARAGAARITVAHVPKGNATGGAIAPIQELRRAGARVALATDNMHADMIEAMRWAVALGRVRAGSVVDDWQPIDALHMATEAGAAAMGLGDVLGRIEIGLFADLVVIDFRRPHLTPVIDPLGNLVHTAQGRDVETVIVGGEIVVDNGRPTRGNLEEIIRDGQRAARQLWDAATT